MAELRIIVPVQDDWLDADYLADAIGEALHSVETQTSTRDWFTLTIAITQVEDVPDGPVVLLTVDGQP